jgi:hypothetical protein
LETHSGYGKLAGAAPDETGDAIDILDQRNGFAAASSSPSTLVKG